MWLKKKVHRKGKSAMAGEAGFISRAHTQEGILKEEKAENKRGAF